MRFSAGIGAFLNKRRRMLPRLFEISYLKSIGTRYTGSGGIAMSSAGKLDTAHLLTSSTEIGLSPAGSYFRSFSLQTHAPQKMNHPWSLMQF